MKTIVHILFLMVFTAAATSQAGATINSIASDRCPNPPCLPSFVQPVVRGVSSNKVSTMTVKGQFVDLSTAVEVTGSGVAVSYGDRTHGSESSIVIRFSVSPTADLTERTVRMRYAIETNGPDTFRIRVIRGGNVTEVRREVISINPLTRVTTTSYVEPTSLPLNAPVTIRFRGTNIGNARFRQRSGITNVTKLAGCTETECKFQMTFTQSGGLTLNLYDSTLGNIDNHSLAFKFYYSGVDDVTIAGTSTPTTSTGTFTPIIGSTSGTTTTFVDAAPRANMINVFRRSGGVVFTDNTNRQFFNVPQAFPNLCSGMSGDASRIVTIPNPVWGVTNVGTANIATAFQAQLRSGNNTLDSRTIASLNTGATQNFNSTRPGDSQVRVFTFLIRSGCFISPQADKFFEDAPFTVVVDTTGVLAESNEANNSQNY